MSEIIKVTKQKEDLEIKGLFDKFASQKTSEDMRKEKDNLDEAMKKYLTGNELKTKEEEVK